MTIERQLELEQSMVNIGARNYLTGQRNAEKDGRGAELDYSRRLMKEFMLPLMAACEEWLEKNTPGKQARTRVLLRAAKPENCMFIALKCIFNSFMMESGVAQLASNIGKMVEDELRFSRFAETHSDYYETIIDDFKRKGSKDYRYMHRVLTHKANEHQHGWIAWSSRERVEVGTKLIDIVLTHTDLIQKSEVFKNGRLIPAIRPTEFALEWVKKHEHTRMFLYPERAPCLIAPDPWTGPRQGGYYSPQLRQVTPMIKTKLTKKQQDGIDWTRVMESINIAQETQWQVNRKVLEIAQYVWTNNLRIGMPGSEKIAIPPSPIGKDRNKDELSDDDRDSFLNWKMEASALYTADKERVSKSFQVSRIIRMASQFVAEDGFWYVWHADSRGRIYSATSGFSPQGPDLAKGILCFKRGMELTDAGVRELKILGANRYGYDKDSYDGRVAWVEERHAQFVSAGNDPLNFTEVWAEADKPYQFLAFLIEYANLDSWIRGGNAAGTFVSYLANGLDGSCNGLQNFSAMLRDLVGGTATNLVPSKTPNDVYREVAEVTKRRVGDSMDAALQAVPSVLDTPDARALNAYRLATLKYAPLWMAFGIDRKTAKRPVMTLPYGSTRQSCTAYIFQAVLDKDKDFFGKNEGFKAAVWLTSHMWAAIGEVVIAATEAMEWLQKCASAMNKVNKPLAWKTPDGFVAYQHSTVIETIKINTQLAGRFQIRIGNHTDILDKNKQRLGIAPNFVHSMDATHLRMTVRRARELGVQDFALIHDDYGSHCANTAKMHQAIRESFVDMYEHNDPLDNFRKILLACGAKVPDMPKKGDLILSDVLKAEYFFG